MDRRRGAGGSVHLRSSPPDSGRLLHRFRDGDAAIRGFLDDYAFLAWGLAELGDATGKKEYFDSAASLLDVLLEDFPDRENGGFYPTGAVTGRFSCDGRKGYDGAIPSGNAVAMAVFLRLAESAGRPEFTEEARRVGEAFGGQAEEEYPLSHAHLLTASLLL